MALAAQQSHSSWCSDNSPMILSEIFASDTSVAIWQREVLEKVNQYFANTFYDAQKEVRLVLSMDSLKAGLAESMPDGDGKADAIDDIHLVSDMLTCLFNCDTVGLRLAPLDKAMCPKFHTDNIQIRLVNTYLGDGTEWLPNELVKVKAGAEITPDRFQYLDSDVHQMKAFEVGLLKGSAWGEGDHLAAIHRSCKVNAGDKRVLLTLDPM